MGNPEPRMAASPRSYNHSLGRLRKHALREAPNFKRAKQQSGPGLGPRKGLGSGELWLGRGSAGLSGEGRTPIEACPG